MKKLTVLITLSLVGLLTACGSSSTGNVTFNPLGYYRGQIVGDYIGSGSIATSVMITEADDGSKENGYEYEATFITPEGPMPGECNRASNTNNLICYTWDFDDTTNRLEFIDWVGLVTSGGWSGTWTRNPSSSGGFDFVRLR